MKKEFEHERKSKGE